MLVLDFINVGNGDSILVREMEGEQLRFSMLVDCGHDSLERDDHPPVEDERSCRIYAGDFLKKHGVAHLDVLLVTHFHRDHIGGLGRVLEAVTVGALEDCIRRGAKGLLKDVSLFDIYTGSGIPEGKKSVAFNLTLRSDDRSLTAQEADEDVKSILETLKAELNAVLR